MPTIIPSKSELRARRSAQRSAQCDCNCAHEDGADTEIGRLETLAASEHVSPGQRMAAEHALHRLRKVREGQGVTHRGGR